MLTKRNVKLNKDKSLLIKVHIQWDELGLLYLVLPQSNIIT